MLERSRPWLLKQWTTLRNRGRALRSQALLRMVRLRLDEPGRDSHSLAERLQDAARARTVTRSMLETTIAANLDAHGLDAVERAVEAALDALCADHSSAAARLYCATLGAFDDVPFARKIAFAEAHAAQMRSNPSALMALAVRHERAGAIERPLELLRRIEGSKPSRTQRRLALQARVLREGVTFGGAVSRSWTPDPARVLYYASQSLPHHSSGYAIRTHGLARTLRASGWDLEVHTRLGYPNDRWDFRAKGMVDPTAVVDGVPYRFSPDRKRGFAVLDIRSYQAASVDVLLERMDVVRPAIVHAASNYLVGLAAVEAARRLGLPSIYEVRGLWHMTRASSQPEYLDSDHYRLIGRLEAQAASAADHVFAITGAVKSVLVDHGVNEEKISVLPNAVDVEHFRPTGRNEALVERIGFRDKLVVGYIGSLKPYEGLDYLLEAIALLRSSHGDSLRALIVGDGSALGDLAEQADRLGIADLVTFTGRVPHEAVHDYYSVIDIMAFPRRGVPVCEVVSPLKPFEAMAMAKPVVASDVAALAEIVRHEETGLLHRKDDASSLAQQLDRFLGDPELREDLAAAGRAWVSEHCTWQKVVDQIDAMYRQLGVGPR